MASKPISPACFSTRKVAALDNNNLFNIVLLIVVILYVVSPADLVPGPIDDIILMLLYARANAFSSSTSN